MSVRFVATVVTALVMVAWIYQPKPGDDLRKVPTAQLRREIIRLGMQCSRTPAVSQLRMAEQQKAMADELIRRGEGTAAIHENAPATQD